MDVNQLSQIQQEFITSEMMAMAWAASVQRANPYIKSETRSDRQVKEFRAELFCFVNNLIPHYIRGCDEETHVRNIESLVTYANVVGVDLLPDHGYTWGIAQKFVNMVLKSLWCLGQISEPPHCPIDSIIIKLSGGTTNWTSIRSAEQYLREIEAIRLLADEVHMSLACWELIYYRRRNPIAVSNNLSQPPSASAELPIAASLV